jgi:hypothetical protein
VADKTSVRFAARAVGAAIAFATLAVGTTFPACAPALAASRTQQMAGTWDISWKNRRGETRRGYMEVEQRGDQLLAKVYDRGGATAIGTISGATFTLRGTRLALPFTVTGRVKGGRMTGMLTALGVERRFTGVRRGRR